MLGSQGSVCAFDVHISACAMYSIPMYVICMDRWIGKPLLIRSEQADCLLCQCIALHAIQLYIYIRMCANGEGQYNNNRRIQTSSLLTRIAFQMPIGN